MTDKIVCSAIVPQEEDEDAEIERTKRQSVSFAKTASEINEAKEAKEQAEAQKSTAEPSMELSSRDERTESPAGSCNGRLLKSGHARTHAIVINLDDKSRFTEEVTV